MPLEQEIAALRVAIEANTAAHLGGSKKAAKAAKDEPAPPPTAPTAANSATAPAGSTQSPTSAPAAVGPDLKTVADQFMALAGRSRDAAVAILTEYKVGKLSEIPAVNLAVVLQKIEAASAKLDAPAQAPASSLI